MWAVVIERLEFYAYHGVSKEEQAVGHRYLLDLEVGVDRKSAGKDDLSGSIDYSELAALALGECGDPKCRTVEAVAHRLAARIFRTYPHAVEVDLWLRKAAPPMALIAESAGVRLTATRKEFGS